MRSKIAALAFLLAAATAHAECPLVETEISGTVLDGDKNPVVGVSVDATWDERATLGIGGKAVTDASGAFTLAIHYNSYSGRGFSGSEKCDFKLDVVNLNVKRAGVGSFQKRIHLDELKAPLAIELR